LGENAGWKARFVAGIQKKKISRKKSSPEKGKIITGPEKGGIKGNRNRVETAPGKGPLRLSFGGSLKESTQSTTGGGTREAYQDTARGVRGESGRSIPKGALSGNKPGCERRTGGKGEKKRGAATSKAVCSSISNQTTNKTPPVLSGRNNMRGGRI